MEYSVCLALTQSDSLSNIVNASGSCNKIECLRNFSSNIQTNPILFPHIEAKVFKKTN